MIEGMNTKGEEKIDWYYDVWVGSVNIFYVMLDLDIINHAFFKDIDRDIWEWRFI